MANTIQHKRGSGSDPDASDLVAGEIAVRTDTGVLFVKKDDNSVISISGGSTNLGTSTTTSAVTVTSSTGDNATISEANGSSAGVMSVAHHDKLDGIAAGATNVTNNNQLTNGAGYITSTLSQEQVEDFVGGMVTGNTETGITVTYQDSDGTLDFVVASQTDNNFTDADHAKLDGIETGATANQTDEEIEDIVGAMLTGNTETGITVTYQDGDGTIDFVVASQTDNNFTDADHTKLNGIATGATANSTESIQDIVGNMVSGNSESGITVTYQDGDGTLDFSVTSQTDNNFTNADHAKLDGIESNATADQTDAEILEAIDYETGTWTPVYRGSSTAGSYSASVGGVYTRVGNKVYASASLINISGSAGSGNLEIAGFPFANNAGQVSLGVIFLDDFNITNTAVTLCAIMADNDSHITVREIKDTAADTTMSVTDRDGSNSDLVVTITYLT